MTLIHLTLDNAALKLLLQPYQYLLHSSLFLNNWLKISTLLRWIPDVPYIFPHFLVNYSSFLACVRPIRGKRDRYSDKSSWISRFCSSKVTCSAYAKGALFIEVFTVTWVRGIFTGSKPWSRSRQSTMTWIQNILATSSGGTMWNLQDRKNQKSSLPRVHRLYSGFYLVHQAGCSLWNNLLCVWTISSCLWLVYNELCSWSKWWCNKVTITCLEKTEVSKVLEKVFNITTNLNFISKISVAFFSEQRILDSLLGQMATFDIQYFVIYFLLNFLFFY